jgi:hypothetical protein
MTIREHHLKMLVAFFVLQAVFYCIQKEFEFPLLDVQPYLPLLGLVAVAMFAASRRMEWIAVPIVSTSDRFELFRKSLQRHGPLQTIYRDGATLYLLSAVVFFVATALRPVEMKSILAIGVVALIKFGYDTYLTYLVLRTERAPSRASEPKSNLQAPRLPERADDEEVEGEFDRIEDGPKKG